MSLFLEKNQKYHGLQLLHYCGGGAYGEVYFAEDISGRQLAVKIVSKEKLGDHWQRELKGVQNYRKITENAPELLQLFHVEEDEDSFFYTMEVADSASNQEYVPDTLACRLKDGPLPQDTVFTVLSGIFAALKIIHEAGFAHRDVKPDNILFVKGVPKLGDVGLLSSLDSSFTQVAGTMDFLPPEVRTADGADSSDRLSRKRNDLYAFGKVIYCAVTGQEPHLWPAVPKGLLLSLPLKFFLRLSFQLCDKDPDRRLNSMAELEKEFAEIERKLLYGETLLDKLKFQLKRWGTFLRSTAVHTLKFLCLHWLSAALAALLLAGGIGYRWYKRPIDITKVKTQLYHNKACGFTLTLPKQWEILTNETVQKQLHEIKREKMGKLPLEEQKRMTFLLELLKLGEVDYIYCDYDKDFPDNITIQKLPLPKKEMFQYSLEEMKVEVKKLFQGELGYHSEIYDIRRSEINGVKCVFVDLSHEPGKTRLNNYLFLFPTYSFAIGMTAKVQTFARRQKEFTQIIQRIKFDKKP